MNKKEKYALTGILLCFCALTFSLAADNNLPRYWEYKDKSGKTKLESVELIPHENDMYELRQWFRGKTWFSGMYKLNGNKLTAVKLQLENSPFYKGFSAEWIISDNRQKMKPNNHRKAGDKRPLYNDFYLSVKKFSPSYIPFSKKMTGSWTITWNNTAGKKFKKKVNISRMEQYELNGKSYHCFKLKPTVFKGAYMLSGKNLVRVAGAENTQSGTGWKYAGYGKFKVTGKSIYLNAIMSKAK